MSVHEDAVLSPQKVRSVEHRASAPRLTNNTTKTKGDLGTIGPLAKVEYPITAHFWLRQPQEDGTVLENINTFQTLSELDLSQPRLDLATQLEGFRDLFRLMRGYLLDLITSELLVEGLVDGLEHVPTCDASRVFNVHLPLERAQLEVDLHLRQIAIDSGLVEISV